jgi:hypothetical protein
LGFPSAELAPPSFLFFFHFLLLQPRATAAPSSSSCSPAGRLDPLESTLSLSVSLVSALCSTLAATADIATLSPSLCRSLSLSLSQAVNQMSLDSNKGLKQDVPTRWNSTYLMLESAIHYRRPFAYLEMTNKNYTFCSNALEWEKVIDINSFLSCFYCATCVFSSTKYLTVNLYFPVIALIYVNLKQELVSGDGYKRLNGKSNVP